MLLHSYSLSLKIVPFLGNLRWVGFSFGWGDFVIDFALAYSHRDVDVFIWICVCSCDLAFDLCTILECILFSLFNFHGLIEYCMLMVLVAFEPLNFLAQFEEIDLFLLLGMGPNWPILKLRKARKGKMKVYAQMNWLLSFMSMDGGGFRGVSTQEIYELIILGNSKSTL